MYSDELWKLSYMIGFKVHVSPDDSGNYKNVNVLKLSWYAQSEKAKVYSNVTF